MSFTKSMNALNAAARNLDVIGSAARMGRAPEGPANLLG